MTPKEKAKELVNIYTMVIYPILNINKSKECALIAVDEIIDYLVLNLITGTLMTYWQQVKQEIEAL